MVPGITSQVFTELIAPNATIINPLLQTIWDYIMIAEGRVAFVSDNVTAIVRDTSILERFFIDLASQLQPELLVENVGVFNPITDIIPAVTPEVTVTSASPSTVTATITQTVTSLPASTLASLTGIPMMPSSPRYLPLFYLGSVIAGTAHNYELYNHMPWGTGAQILGVLSEGSTILVPGWTAAATLAVQSNDRVGIYIAFGVSAVCLIGLIVFRQHIPVDSESLQHFTGYLINFIATIAGGEAVAAARVIHTIGLNQSTIETTVHLASATGGCG